tara:strand:- start:2043 stop:2372 length:330 start_codon:yes stop_codon:yes gene_type:complete
MAKPVKRRIIVKGQVFYWVLNGNSIDTSPNQERHIKVHLKDLTKSILYIDPYPWEFQIRPKNIELAIKFAQSQGWDPKKPNCSKYISQKENKFFVLPAGQKFGHSENVL